MTCSIRSLVGKQEFSSRYFNPGTPNWYSTLLSAVLTDPNRTLKEAIKPYDN